MRKTRQRLALAAALVGLCLAGAGGAVAQQATGTVVGQITDATTKRPLASAQVFVVGTQRGALTNAEGHFVISQVPAGARTVRVTVLGYADASRAVTVAAGGSATANFALSQSAVELNAVVVSAVTGQAERKAQMGSNVTNVSVAPIDNGQVNTLSDVLNGRTAGVDLKAVSGSTGSAAKIRIRGANSLSLSNEPLIYVDGVLFHNPQGTGFDDGSTAFGTGGQDLSRLNDINPDDIANIEVLKGPAASAMYGTAAANGVLLITTKRGRAGKATWNFYGETGTLQDKAPYPRTYLSYEVDSAGAPLLTASGAFDKTARVPCANYQAATGSCTQDSTMSFLAIRDPRTTPFSTGHHQQYGLSVAGGNDVARYFVSGSMMDEQGVVFYNKQRQLNLRSNLDARLLQDLTLHVSAAYTTGTLDRPQNDNNIFSPLLNALYGGAFYYPDVNGTYNSRNYYMLDIHDLSALVTSQDINHFLLGTTANYQPLPWLSANVNVGLDLADTRDGETLAPNGPLGFLGDDYEAGYRQVNQASSFTYSATGSAAATFDLTPTLNSMTTIGAQYNKTHNYSTYGYGVGLVQGTSNLGATSSLFSVDEAFYEMITIGAFAQEKLAWKDRLFVSGGLRTDDNSAFGADYGRIVYPSASISWLASQEPFFPKYDWLSTLRLRSAWGTSGQRPNFRDAVTYYSPVSATVDNANVSAVTLSASGNDKLKPELTSEYEAGFDLGLLKERLSAGFTFFHKRSRDALISKPLAPSLGLTSSMFFNLGAIQNNGTELSLRALAINTKNVQLNLDVSATTLHNKILTMGDSTVPPITLNRGNQKHQVGYSAGGFWGLPYSYSDPDHDGKLALSDVQLLPADTSVYIGPVLPTFTRSFSGDLTLFRIVTISSLFDWRGGNYTDNETLGFRCSHTTIRADRANCAGVMDPNASLADQARFIALAAYGSNYGYIEKADFVKWRELSVTLNSPEWLTSRLGVTRNASITFAGRNLHTWTDYTGIDPEVNEGGSAANFGQDEFNTQPPVRYYTVRLNFKF